MFPFQAIHNAEHFPRCARRMSKSYYQCFLFKQFTTQSMYLDSDDRCQRAIINVSFSSNSQPVAELYSASHDVKELLSMFPFQAIHNTRNNQVTGLFDVKELLSMFPFQAIHNREDDGSACFMMSKSYYQCFLFKQFTTLQPQVLQSPGMSKSYYQCFLFKQFTTRKIKIPYFCRCQRAIINVSFSSNSQQFLPSGELRMRCQRAIINVSFSSNSQLKYDLCSACVRCQRAIINVSFSSNSQPRPPPR